MKNYYKYLPVSKEDENWGLTVLNVGATHILPSDVYPQKTHPDHHNFNWKAGRVLNEYQVIYIINGEGVFESESQPLTKINAGTIIFLFPNERHRYRPDNRTGWDEYWIGVNGPIAENLLSVGYLNPKTACNYVGFHQSVLDIFLNIIEHTVAETSGYQPLVSGAALYLLGTIHAITKQNFLENSEDEVIVNKAKCLFRSNVSSKYSAEKAAADLNVGYSWFRKHFKFHTGISPGQYYLQLKIEQGKTLLLAKNYSIKEIAFELNFESTYYFSNVFRKKTGLKPTEYRKQVAAMVK
ncbi:AraC family transcriptional regulator [Mucilaginibacter corticis]|uniref:AraC family transcriptional regulator n=1 Tax=Mucilaginibacter corticis TaxID=2597670 RepID=A0A556MWZ8_9SPHI|nr:AraC family transcriptional regulator [Mucilaginibacter corticis]TSJ44450.1 AraC family transcriptional regulator [Mucilaginibacter corticis]